MRPDPQAKAWFGTSGIFRDASSVGLGLKECAENLPESHRQMRKTTSGVKRLAGSN